MTFYLPNADRRWYSLPDLAASTVNDVPIVVPVDGWEATFDYDQTWHRSQAHPDRPTAPAWLLAHPAFPGPGDTNTHLPNEILVLFNVAPRVRLIDSPETVSESADRIVIG